MSFTFDEKYIQLLKTRDEETVKMGYAPFTTVFNAYLDWVEDMALCDCGAGCRDTAGENAAKLVAIIRGMQESLSAASLDAMALKDPKAYQHDLFEEMWKKARAPKD